jgi:hypothetical protein
MSGSGGGGDDQGWRPNPKAAPQPRSGRGGDATIPDVCNITETTNLNSVDRAVLATLQPGTQLDVVFQAGPPQRLVAQTAQGAVAGSITSPSMLQIIQCIQGGVRYTATVVSIRGAQCQVRIEPT